MEHYLPDAAAQIDEHILVAEANLVDHLLHKQKRCLAVDFGREWLVAFVQLQWVANRVIVAHLDDVVQQLGRRWLFALNRSAFPL